MPKSMRPDLKQEIQEAAWKLFYEKGYENTTVNDIVRAAGTSKGGFYYYFEAKEALLNSLYPILDRAYEKYYRNMSRAGGAMEQIKQMNQYVFYFIEGNVRRDLLVALYQSQLLYAAFKADYLRGAGKGGDSERCFRRGTEQAYRAPGAGNFDGVVHPGREICPGLPGSQDFQFLYGVYESIKGTWWIPRKLKACAGFLCNEFGGRSCSCMNRNAPGIKMQDWNFWNIKKTSKLKYNN